MNKRPHSLFLEDIIEAIEKIEEFTKNMDLEKFSNDDKTTSAVLRKLEIIGEATKNIPSGVKEKHPEIPWKRMAGLRDIVIHEYFGVEVGIVWKIITENLPEVKPMLKKILEESS
jgi:uncharacterized protein with HEPN domain